jgi:quercetin dioxygenase-like cupin family protein
MNTVRNILIIAGLTVCAALNGVAQEEAKVVTAQSSKFANLPVFPTCATVSVQRGDPAKSGAVFLARLKAGCNIPWHWHTAAENLMIVSGVAKVQMKNPDTTNSLAPGDYVFLPGKHVHQFTCVSGCTFFIATEGAFDIHYVDNDGKEIPVDQAIAPKKTSPKTAPKK